jgi:hypothetical protein
MKETCPCARETSPLASPATTTATAASTTSVSQSNPNSPPTLALAAAALLQQARPATTTTTALIGTCAQKFHTLSTIPISHHSSDAAEHSRQAGLATTIRIAQGTMYARSLNSVLTSDYATCRGTPLAGGTCNDYNQCTGEDTHISAEDGEYSFCEGSLHAKYDDYNVCTKDDICAYDTSYDRSYTSIWCRGTFISGNPYGSEKVQTSPDVQSL